jgi:hypothetical protein
VKDLRSGRFIASSQRRLARTSQILEENVSFCVEKDIIKRVLSDIGDSEFPICRCGTDPDYGISDHAVIFDLKERVCEVYHNPLRSPAGLAIVADRIDDISLVFKLP